MSDVNDIWDDEEDNELVLEMFGRRKAKDDYEHVNKPSKIMMCQRYFQGCPTIVDLIFFIFDLPQSKVSNNYFEFLLFILIATDHMKMNPSLSQTGLFMQPNQLIFQQIDPVPYRHSVIEKESFPSSELPEVLPYGWKMLMMCWRICNCIFLWNEPNAIWS